MQGVMDTLRKDWDIRPQPSVRSKRWLLGGLITLLKRLIRRSIFWFVYPFVERQAAYNRVLSEALGELSTQVSSASAGLEHLEGVVCSQQQDARRKASHNLAPAMQCPVFSYLAFENRFRGSSEMLKERQQQYVKYFHAGLVLDLGCGRGEFLQLLREKGIPARGVDASPEMVKECRNHGLDVKLADALVSLGRLPDQSLGGIFSAQLVEHLLPDEVMSLVALAHRKLKQGGVLIVETINPLSVHSLLHSYQLDPTHVRPVHPSTLAFIAEACGYSGCRIEYLSPAEPSMKVPRLEATGAVTNLSEFNAGVDRLNSLLYGPQDYALIAHR